MPSQIIPSTLQSVLWSVDVNKLDWQRDKNYIIHQVLIYGDINELRWLLQTYTKKTVADVFLNCPAKIYPKEMFRFVKDYILGMEGLTLDEEDYVTAFFGPVRQRTANRLA